MRNLKLSDAGKVSKILKKVQLRVDGQGNIESPEALGASLFLLFLENYHIAEKDVAELMAELIGDEMTASKFLELDLNDAVPYFEEIKKDPGLDRFFKLLGKLM